jgi:hypothetical protein
MELTKTNHTEKYITLLEAANILAERCERDLTIFEFRALTSYFKKYTNQVIYQALQKLPNRFIEHPISYLKSILESSSGKEKVHSILKTINTKDFS